MIYLDEKREVPKIKAKLQRNKARERKNKKIVSLNKIKTCLKPMKFVNLAWKELEILIVPLIMIIIEFILN